MKVIIAEKPSLAMNVVKSIGSMNKADGYFQNRDYIVTFAYGHLLRLCDVDDYFNREKTKWSLNELPFVPGDFKFGCFCLSPRKGGISKLIIRYYLRFR